MLTQPDVRFRESFLAAMAEFQAEGRAGPDDNSMLGREVRTFGATWADPDGFAVYVRALVADARQESPRPEGFVPSTTLWWAEGDTYLGRLAIRHRLNGRLRKIGGHIGYDVRPSARRRGHATAMLRAGLAVASDLGIDPALLTCLVDNTASRRVIERNGGKLEDEYQGMLRFWVPCS